MNVLPDPQSAKRGALWGFVIGGHGSIISVFSSFWEMRIMSNYSGAGLTIAEIFDKGKDKL